MSFCALGGLTCFNDLIWFQKTGFKKRYKFGFAEEAQMKQKDQLVQKYQQKPACLTFFAICGPFLW